MPDYGPLAQQPVMHKPHIQFIVVETPYFIPVFAGPWHAPREVEERVGEVVSGGGPDFLAEALRAATGAERKCQAAEESLMATIQSSKQASELLSEKMNKAHTECLQAVETLGAAFRDVSFLWEERHGRVEASHASVMSELSSLVERVDHLCVGDRVPTRVEPHSQVNGDEDAFGQNPCDRETHPDRRDVPPLLEAQSQRMDIMDAMDYIESFPDRADGLRAARAFGFPPGILEVLENQYQ